MKPDALDVRAWPELYQARYAALRDQTLLSKQDLDRAEQDLDRAEQRLRDAEQRIRRAKQDTPTVEDFLSQNSLWLLEVPPSCRPQRVGRGGFDREICGVLSESFWPDENQKSVAFVLASASGVGKTYATMCFRSGAAKINAPYDAVTIYLGLHQGWMLTHSEQVHMATESIKEMAVYSVAPTAVCCVAQYDQTNQVSEGPGRSGQ